MVMVLEFGLVHESARNVEMCAGLSSSFDSLRAWLLHLLCVQTISALKSTSFFSFVVSEIMFCALCCNDFVMRCNNLVNRCDDVVTYKHDFVTRCDEVVSYCDDFVPR